MGEISSFPFNVVAGTDINSPLIFAPTAVIVNNYSPFYIYFPDGLTFCSPWTTGVVIPLAHATQARAIWTQSPFGTQVIVAVPGITYQANLTFTNDPNQSLSGGTPVAPPPDTRSAVYTAAPGATLTTGALPFTAFGIRVDNLTGTWYSIGTTGILVPPFTTGFTLNLLPPLDSVVLAPATPPYGQPNNNTGTGLTVTLFPTTIGDNPGTTKTFTFNSQTFTANGTFTVPAGVTSLTIFGVGGGGGGGTGGATSAGGGGGGAEIKTSVVAVATGLPLTIVIGTGGPANTIGNPSTVTGAGVAFSAAGGGAGGTLNGAGGNGASGGGGASDAAAQHSGGGGGGSGAVGQNAGNGLGPAGGNATAGNIGGHGSTNTVATAGNGGTDTNGLGGGGGGGGGSIQNGGTGGGTSGGKGGDVTAPGVGKANTGGGGGGGRNGGVNAGAAGGTGLVILSWLT